MKIKKFFYVLFIMLLLAALGASGIWFFTAYVPSQYKKVDYQPAALTESAKLLNNPYCGFYRIYGYILSNNTTDWLNQVSENIKNDPNPFVQLQINLMEFRDSPLSETALSQLETLLSIRDNSSKTYILRVLYDWDGKSKETEPKDISLILHHMEQIAPIINRHKRAILVMQGIFVGNCGEMHSSPYTSNENMVTLIQKLDSVIDPDIFLSVRTPTHYRTIVQTFEPLSSADAYSGTMRARLGLFNDGMLGSDFDLGTYGPDSLVGKTDYTAKGTRAEEIAFQNELCNYVPNGGECVLDNPYNDFDAAIQDLSKMHVSYLNCDYDAKVLNKWKASTYNGADVFSGMNGLAYIKAHLGYRYVITDSQLSYERFRDRSATIQVRMKNVGFASAYRPFVSTLTLVADSPEASCASVSYRSEFDNRFLVSGTEDDVSFSVDTSSLEPGTYRAYFKMTDSSIQPSAVISFANEQDMTDYGILVGTLTVE